MGADPAVIGHLFMGSPLSRGMADAQGDILIEGKNCWRKRRAGRVSFLIDGAAYFHAFAQSVERAKKSICIAAWDINSEIELLRTDQTQGARTRLGDFLNRLVSHTPGLHAYILAWDFSMIFALERQLLSVFNLGWKTHRRIHFYHDGNHPVGASHHQKIVVIDDAIAFVGGLDFTKCRWDTSAHQVDDSRRRDPRGRPYPPFHDVQMLVDEEAARSLGDLFRRRWQQATGKKLTTPLRDGDDPWPLYLKPDLTDVTIAIARTEPAFQGREEVREVEALYLDAIAHARKYLYIENQFMTSSAISDVLADRLREQGGPEIVIVLPRQNSGWLEKNTMQVIRAHVLKRLFEADRDGRLRVYYPSIAGTGDTFINVHAKVLIVDDDFIRIGSSNLSNRSMGLDTECDLALEAEGKTEVRKAIALLRNRLLGEHLGVAPEKVEEAMASNNSLIGTVEAMRRSGRTLLPLDDEPPKHESPLSDPLLVDPEGPVDLEQLMSQFVPEEIRLIQRFRLGGRVAMLLVVLLGLTGLAAAWHFTPLGSRVDVDTIVHAVAAIRESSAAPLIIIATYLIGGLIIFPVTVLISATAIVFEPLSSIIYAFGGCLASSVLMYGIGGALGRATVRRVAGSRLNRLSKLLVRQDLFAIAALRVLPVAPYSIVNIVAGASHMRFRDFMLGTALALAPGIVAISVLAEHVKLIIREPHLKYIFSATILILLCSGVIFLIGKSLARHTKQKDEASRGTEAHRP